jgi:anti-sigma factor RsiW
MRCRDAKYRLTAQHEGDLAQPEVSPVQEHLARCRNCRSYERRQQRLDTMLQPPLPHMYQPIATERIMHAVQQQRQITQQLEDIRTQQKARVARLRILPPLIALAFSVVGGLAVLVLGLAFFQPDVLERILALMGDVIEVFFLAVQYLQAGLELITRNNLILSGIALVLVVMMGMWLRLMRYPQEA